MRYWKMKKYDIANGVGLRVSIWFTGCNFHCKDCFNEHIWSFESGKEFDASAEDELFKLLSDPHIKGISILGGEPLEQGNELIELLAKIKKMYPPKDVWLWTGYYLEEILANSDKARIINYCDYIVEGRFDHTKKDSNLLFRGSSNQRIYQNQGNAGFVLIEKPETYFKK